MTECANEHEAAREFEELRWKKLREGFACVADATQAARGAVVLDVKVPTGPGRRRSTCLRTAGPSSSAPCSRTRTAPRST
ncbi:hypothetical protein SAZ11_34635 [Streptomyces sp. FXJ1.4098]|nr:hypothetical protein [Streptomyces sp. FXJ1.4098]